ncbi:unnamed protein product [Coregonus sp. 'balchen']|nr:unnamed protein product [Coregonus sp. 'balchen']
MKFRDTGTTTSRDHGDTSSTSSVEVKENRDSRNQVDYSNILQPGYHPSSALCTDISKRKTTVDCTMLPAHHPSALYTDISRGLSRTTALQRKQPLGQFTPLVFAVGVEVNGLRFEGRGPTKKKAKMRAAELALRSFIQFPNAPQAHITMGNLNFINTTAPTDFTSDQADLVPDTLFKEFEPEVQEDQILYHRTGGKELQFEEPPAQGQLHRTVEKGQELLSSICNHGRLVRLTLDLMSSANQKRQRIGSSIVRELRPVALLNELRPGLRYVCLTENVRGRPIRSFVMAVRVDGRVFEGCGRSQRLAKAQAAASALQDLFNIKYIFHLVREKYSELADCCCTTSQSHRRFDLRRAQVVSLGTGTKCISGEFVSDQGRAVNDCHAESIFVRDKESGYRLRDGILFHMYVSSSPCGDARLNCPYEITATHHSGYRFVRKLRCHLRMKMEGGEGTLPVSARRANQKWDRGLSREPPVTMSCTDKIASLTVGSLCHTGHLGRTMARRMGHIAPLPSSYRRNRLLLGCLSSSEGLQPGKSRNFSVNWSAGDGELEVEAGLGIWNRKPPEQEHFQSRV